MDVYFKDGEIRIKARLEGFDDKVRYDLLHKMQEAVDLQKEIDIRENRKINFHEQPKDDTDKYKEGYQALATKKSGLHHPTSEFEDLRNKLQSTKPPKEYGVRKMDDGEKRYQLFYICDESSCGHKGKRYVPHGSVYTNCHECGNRMNIRTATEKGFGYQDEYNNYYIAGSFQRNFNAQKTLAGTTW